MVQDFWNLSQLWCRRYLVLSILYLVFSLILLRRWSIDAGTGTDPGCPGRVRGRYEFARLVTLPVEDRAKYMPQVKWSGEYRWFRSPNIVCLEKYRRLKVAGRL